MLVGMFLELMFQLSRFSGHEIRTDETVDVSCDGQTRHTITQVTKTTFLEDHEMEVEEELRVEQVVPMSVSMQQREEGRNLSSAATWQSGEQDTSQVSVSSLPEDEKSEPTTATISSTTSTTGGLTSAVVVEHSTSNESTNVRVTVQQKGTF